MISYKIVSRPSNASQKKYFIENLEKEINKDINVDLSFFINFVNSWETKEIESSDLILRNCLIPFFNSFENEFDISLFLFENNVLKTLMEILKDSINSFHSITAFNIIKRIIQLYPQTLEFFFSPDINLQEILYDILFQHYQPVPQNPYNYEYYLSCTIICIIASQCSYTIIKEFFQFKDGLLTVILNYLYDTFSDTLDNEDGSASYEIYFEKNLLDTIDLLLLNDDIDKFNLIPFIGECINCSNFDNLMRIHFIILSQPRYHLIKLSCKFLHNFISKYQKGIIYFGEHGFDEKNTTIIQKVIELIQLDLPSEVNLSPAFSLLSDILYYDPPESDIENNFEKIELHKSIMKIVSNIDGSSIFGYLFDDINTLSNEKYDQIYRHVLRLLNNLIWELGCIPDDIDANQVKDVVSEINTNGRHKLKAEMMQFFCTYTRFLKTTDLIQLFNNEFAVSVFESICFSGKDLFYVFIETISHILSIVGKYMFETENAFHLFNETIPSYIQEMIEAGYNDKQACEIMETYYSNTES